MIENVTNLCKKEEGPRTGACHVCTGCGRCQGIHRDMKVLVNFLHGNLQEQRVQTAQHNAQETASRGLVLSIDLGTTTIAIALYDLKGHPIDYFAEVNPQVQYGADVLSRIEAATDGLKAKHLQSLVMEVLERGCRKLLQERQVEDERLTCVLACNTTMLYLLVGRNPEELGHAPFQVRHKEVTEISIAGRRCTCVPVLSAFVGGDIMSGISAVGMQDSEETMLFIDLGTNGEIVLGNKHRIIACATAAGPAFEGGPSRGIWGADMVHLLAQLRKRQLVDETGLLSEAYFEEGVQIEGVHITQQAIRAFQLAKAAIRAGIEELLESYGITETDVARVVLAGGFGYYLNPKEAAQVGLLSEELAGKTVAVGNASLWGAFKTSYAFAQGKDEAVKAVWQRLQQDVEILNLAEQEGFQERFVEEMNFPE